MSLDYLPKLTVVSVRGVELSVSTSGKGMPFLWGHGLTSNCIYEDEIGFYNWNHVATSVQLVRYDARGHGVSQGSFENEDYLWHSLALDMIGLADNIGAKQFIVGGTSMGCATALFVMLMVPHRVKALILANPPAVWDERSAKAEKYKMFANLAELEGLTGLLKKLKERPLPKIFAQELPEMANIKFRHFANLNENVIPHIYHGTALSDFPPRNQLRQIKIPTLVFAWTDDSDHPTSTAIELNDLIKGSMLNIAHNLKDIYKWPSVIHDFIKSLTLRP